MVNPFILTLLDSRIPYWRARHNFSTISDIILLDPAKSEVFTIKSDRIRLWDYWTWVVLCFFLLDLIIDNCLSTTKRCKLGPEDNMLVIYPRGEKLDPNSLGIFGIHWEPAR
jgi:hypothetical protein